MAQFRMPAEWAPHAATWTAWPHDREQWLEGLDEPQRARGGFVVRVAHEQVDALAAAVVDDRGDHLHECPLRVGEPLEPLLRVKRPRRPGRGVRRPLGGHAKGHAAVYYVHAFGGGSMATPRPRRAAMKACANASADGKRLRGSFAIATASTSSTAVGTRPSRLGRTGGECTT